jgi:hypothetical protein
MEQHHEVDVCGMNHAVTVELLVSIELPHHEE